MTLPSIPPGRLALLQSLARDTPCVPIQDEVTGCTVWLKLEYLLPSGSTKDRLAARVLSEAAADGRLTPASTVVEASSGSTSISLAMACALLGIRFTCVMPSGVSGERVLLIRRYGGTVELTSTSRGLVGAIARAEELARDDDSVLFVRQFENPANTAAHAEGTGPELLRQVARPLDGFVAAVGTGGTLMGVARALRASGHATRIVQARPVAGSILCGEPEICGGIPGVVEGVSRLLDPAAVALDDPIDVTDYESVQAARQLCARGFSVGPSSGLNFAAARALARDLGPGHHIATVLSDRAERYFSTPLFDDLRPAHPSASLVGS